MGSTLAHYAAAGEKVYYVCSTGGEIGTVEPHFLEEYKTIVKLREHELKCAADELRLAGLYYLGYRDSGMPGSPDNDHPDAMTQTTVEEAAGRVVKILREIKPDVVITHDAGGGYGHPDHVATHQAVVKAFYAAGDPEQYPEAGPAFKPAKLYYVVRPHKLMRFMIRMMPLFGQDPHHFGRNKDIDLTKTTEIDYPVHAVIRYTKKAREMRMRASACHASQGGGVRRRPGLFRTMEMIEKLMGPRDMFMREYPQPTNGRVEKDLLEGLS